MGIYDRLINLYVNSEDSDLDRQIVAECRCDSVCSIDKVVRQFKFLTNNMHDSEEYLIVKKYLESIFGMRIIKTLEEM